jgi:RNA polymerase sigma factor (sigma-70 family)
VLELEASLPTRSPTVAPEYGRAGERKARHSLKSCAAVTKKPTMIDGEFASLLAALKAGDDAAWELTFGDLAGPVLGYLRMRGAAEPEDLCSEVFLRVARSVGAFEGDERSFRSWVFTIAHHQLLDARRRGGRTPTLVAVDDRAEVVVERGPGVEEQVEALSGWRDALALVDQLTESQREVVLLRVVGGLSLDEVARIVGKQPNAVKQLQHRAIGALQRLVNGPG